MRKIKKLFEKGGFDILLLQETRSDGSEKEIKKWKKVFNCKHIYSSSFGTQAVGAGIIIHSEESFNVLHNFSDPLGRYVAVIGDHEEGKLLMLSFYSPSVAKEIKDFVLGPIYSRLESLGADLPEFLIVGGDTNTIDVFHGGAGGAAAPPSILAGYLLGQKMEDFHC